MGEPTQSQIKFSKCMVPSYMAHLLKDKKLIAAIEQQQPFELVHREYIHLYLCKSIMSQQLSTRVADVIYNRFLDLFEGKNPTPRQIAEMPFEKLRAIGLSNAKTNYVQNVAHFALEQGIEASTLKKMDNEEIISYLTQIKGVGRWTVEMLLMFSLGREDVFAVDDLGIQQAMAGIYNLKVTDKKKLKERMLRISVKWKPYRTYACLHLWRWQNNLVAQAIAQKRSSDNGSS